MLYLPDRKYINLLSHYQYSSGEASSIMVWDLEKEQLVSSVPSSGCMISALVSSNSSYHCHFHTEFVHVALIIMRLCSLQYALFENTSDDGTYYMILAIE